MNSPLPKFDVVTITLNPAIDLTAAIGNFTPGIVNRAGQPQITAGGKGVNVAAALGDHGHRVAATGFLGRANSGCFEALFAEKRIADCFVRIPGLTRTGVKITDDERNETTDINFPGLTPAPAELDALQDRLAALEADWFVIGGSLPSGVDTAIYRDMIRALKARGGKVVLDTSGDALVHGIEAAPHIIKPNIHELEALAGKSLSNKEAMIEVSRSLIAKGVDLVAVSLGKQGACFVTQDAVASALPPDVAVKSTVGAGDAMVAGIVAAHLRKLPLQECVQLAIEFSVDVLKRNSLG